MKKIELFEQAIRDRATNFKSLGINETLFRAYVSSLTAGNDIINFSETIEEQDVKPIADCLKENKINEFTISNTFVNLIPILEAFDAEGFRLAVLTKVNTRYKNWWTGEPAVVPAIRLIRI